MKIEVAHIVRATAGREKGALFFVLDTQGEYLLLADGKRRKAGNPKRKKRRHVRFAAESALPLTGAIRRGEPVTDQQLRRALAIRRATEKQEGGSSVWQRTT